MSETWSDHVPKGPAYNDTILANLDAVPNRCGLDDSIRTNVNKIADLHRVVIKVSFVRLVRWPALNESTKGNRVAVVRQPPEPNVASITDQTVPPDRNYNSMSRTRSSKVASYDSATGNDRFATEDDVLGT